MATAPSPNDLTRQQLDELDALLQRMLSVPLAPADTPMPASVPPRSGSDGPPLPPTWRVDPPAPAGGASLPHLPLPEPPAPVPPPPVPVPAPKPAAAAPAPKPAPPPASVPAPAPKAPPPVVPPPISRTALPDPAPAAPPVPLVLLPLVAFNVLFDSICGLFGPLGRVLRSGFCKQVYGLVGLGLLIYTAAHIAQEQGWLTLPIPLPWPR